MQIQTSCARRVFVTLPLLALSMSMLLITALPTQAQDYGPGDQTGDYGSGGNDGNGDNPNDRVGARSNNPFGILSQTTATPAATAAITRALRDASALCERSVGREYLVDCLGERLGVIAKAMPKSGDYNDARIILADTSTKLRALAAANRAPGKPRVRVKSTVNRKPVTTRPLTPVRAQVVRQVNARAADIMQEAETRLLRSAQSSDRRLIAYAEMAKAVGSNKILLRSA